MMVNIKIYGDVQGVFFRHGSRVEAQKLGLTGWVKNNSDSSVEAEACGEKENLEKFIAWCGKGPPFANVKKVEVKWSNKQVNYESFDVIH